VRVQQGQWVEALKAYDRILTLDPTDASAKLGSARFAMLTRQMKVAEAEQILNGWLETYPNTPPPIEFFELLGELPTNESRADLYSRLIQLNPTDLKLQRRSLELLAQKDPAAARKQLAAFMARSQGDVNAYYLQGEVARSLADLDLAAAAYDAILAKQPENVDALAALAGVRFEQERYEEARGIYQRAIGLRPNDWSLRRTLAALSLAQDEPFTALEQLKVVQSLQRQQGIKDEVTDYEVTRLEVERLKRRSFQPDWEGYTPLKKRK
jgi:cellulose synthase operon protein C